MQDSPEGNWFTTLLAPRSRHLKATYCLLTSGHAPSLDVQEYVQGLPVLGHVARASKERRPDGFWKELENDRPYQSRRQWMDGFDPLPLSPQDTPAQVPALPDATGELTAAQPYRTSLSVEEALFARLLAMGADPWQSWPTDQGQADGFDLALAWGCAPLVEACLRHPSRPPLAELYQRSPWRLRDAPGWTDSTGAPLFSPSDTLVHAATAADDLGILKVLLDHGWSATSGSSDRSPLALARTSAGLSILLEAGAPWDARFLEEWQHLAKSSPIHAESLASRIAQIEERELGVGQTQEMMIQLALSAFRKSDALGVEKALSALDPEGVGGKQRRHATPPGQPSVVVAAWAGLPPVAFPGGALKKLGPMPPLFHLASMGLQEKGAGKVLQRLVPLLIDATRFFPDIRVAPNVSIRGLAALVWEHTTKKDYRNPSLWGARQGEFNEALSQAFGGSLALPVQEAAQAAQLFMAHGTPSQKVNAQASVNALMIQLTSSRRSNGASGN